MRYLTFFSGIPLENARHDLQIPQFILQGAISSGVKCVSYMNN
jgi:hypothetical protein